MSQIRTKLVIAEAIKTRLEGIRLSSGHRTFERVGISSSSDLVEALRLVNGFGDRVAIIYCDGSTPSSTVEGRALVSRMTHHFLVICSDRDLGNRQNALVGDSDSPGILEMMDDVFEDLHGKNLGYEDVLCMPKESQPLIIQQGSAPGREAWTLEVDVIAGWQKTTVNR